MKKKKKPEPGYLGGIGSYTKSFSLFKPQYTMFIFI